MIFVHNDYQQRRVNAHCIQINEWKALRFAFYRSERTKDLYAILDRYENTTAAFQGGNDGEIVRTFGPPEHMKRGCKDPESFVSLSFGSDAVSHRLISATITIKEDRICRLIVRGLWDHDLRDASYLPKHLETLALIDGSITRIDLSKLPRELKNLDLQRNKITNIIVRDIPFSLGWLALGNNPMEKEGIVLMVPLPEYLTLQVPFIDSLDLDGGQKQRCTIRVQGTKYKEGHWEVLLKHGTKVRVIDVE